MGARSNFLRSGLTFYKKGELFLHVRVSLYCSVIASHLVFSVFHENASKAKLLLALLLMMISWLIIFYYPKRIKQRQDALIASLNLMNKEGWFRIRTTQRPPSIAERAPLVRILALCIG